MPPKTRATAAIHFAANRRDRAMAAESRRHGGGGGSGSLTAGEGGRGLSLEGTGPRITTGKPFGLRWLDTAFEGCDDRKSSRSTCDRIVRDAPFFEARHRFRFLFPLRLAKESVVPRDPVASRPCRCANVES